MLSCPPDLLKHSIEHYIAKRKVVSNFTNCLFFCETHQWPMPNILMATFEYFICYVPYYHVSDTFCVTALHLHFYLSVCIVTCVMYHCLSCFLCSFYNFLLLLILSSSPLASSSVSLVRLSSLFLVPTRYIIYNIFSIILIF